MEKIAVTSFNQETCAGCPHRVSGGESTGRPLIDALASIETGVLSGATGEKQAKCGLCGCPLKNLELFNRAPVDCPRVGEHGGQA